MLATNSPSALGGITQYSIFLLVMPFFLASDGPSPGRSIPRLLIPPFDQPTVAASNGRSRQAAYPTAERSISPRQSRRAVSASATSLASFEPMPPRSLPGRMLAAPSRPSASDNRPPR